MPMSLLGSHDLGAAQFVYRSRHATFGSILWTIWRKTPTCFRALFYWLLLKLGRKTRSPRVTSLPFGLYAKHGRYVAIAEAFATQFVNLNTDIPVPTILDALIDLSGKPFILMTHVPGKPLADMPGSAEDLSQSQLAKSTETVRSWLEQLHRLKPPATAGMLPICGFGGTPFMSYRVDHDCAVEPYASVRDFHSAWFCTLPPEADPLAISLASRMRQRDYRICFSHGHISPNNLLVNDDYLPVGLINWGCAAWLPEYWDLTTSLYRRQRDAGWRQIFINALPQYEEEIVVETELWKWMIPW